MEIQVTVRSRINVRYDIHLRSIVTATGILIQGDTVCRVKLGEVFGRTIKSKCNWCKNIIPFFLFFPFSPYLVSSYGQRVFFSQFCQVGGLAVIHKMNEPNWLEVRQNSSIFSNSRFVLATSITAASKCDDFWQFCLKIWQILRQIRKKTLWRIQMWLFFVAMVRKFAKKKPWL